MNIIRNFFITLMVGFFVCSMSNTQEQSQSDFVKEAEKELADKKRSEDYSKFFETGECHRCDLQGLDLRAAIQQLNERGKKIALTYSNLDKANLSGANLQKAYLFRAILSGADLSNINFNGAEIRNSDLRNTKLNAASLSGTEIVHSVFSDSDLQSVTLRPRYIAGANFSFTENFSDETLKVEERNSRINVMKENESNVEQLSLEKYSDLNLLLEKNREQIEQLRFNKEKGR